jgi:hypothetical protein
MFLFTGAMGLFCTGSGIFSRVMILKTFPVFAEDESHQGSGRSLRASSSPCEKNKDQ